MAPAPPMATEVRARLHPALLVFFAICVPLLLLLLYFVIKQHDPTLLLAGGIFGALLLFSYLRNRSYRLYWDKDTMYLRPLRNAFWRKGVRQLRFTDATFVEAGFGVDAERKAKFMPFEFLEVYGTGHEEPLVIEPAYMNDQDIKAFLRHFLNLRPELFTDEVIAYIGSERPI